MKLSSKGRYAVMALADLARFNSENPVSLRDISLRQGISLDYLEQIFLKLKKNNIVKSIRGANGGYILTKNPDTQHCELSKFSLSSQSNAAAASASSPCPLSNSPSLLPTPLKLTLHTEKSLSINV